MKKNVMMSAFLGAVVVATGVAQADDATELQALKRQVEMQKQEMIDLLAKMEQIEKSQQNTKTQMADMSWASNVKLKGDFRYRYEMREEDTAGDDDKNRERIRARIGLEAQVNDEVKFGARLATGNSSSATSTNQTIGDKEETFSKKNVWIDLAYVTYSPEAVAGLDVTLGKMKKPWAEVSDLVFDGDVNPDGIAVNYDAGVAQFTAATLVVDDEYTEDVRLNVLQVAGDLEPSEEVSMTLGATYFGVTNDEGSGDVDQGFDIGEMFAVADLEAGLPLSLTGHYANNFAADSDGAAFLVGLSTKAGDWKFGYDYRRVEQNANIESLNDGDFGNGDGTGCGWTGHKLKAGYSISKNFSAGASYFFAMEEIDGDEEGQLLQLDLKAKF